MTDRIEHCRNVAMEILKPSQKDLEHGLELHADSVVCESYGFMPYCAPHGDEIRRRIDEGASSNELSDLMVKMNRIRCLEDADEWQEYWRAWQAAGVTCVLQNSGEETSLIEQNLKRLAHATMIAETRSGMTKVRTSDDIKRTKAQGKHGLCLISNAVPLSGRFNSVQEELEFIEIFAQLGCRMIGITYNRRNLIGDGCAEATDVGLSDFGKAVVAEMNRTGMIVDVGHSGLQTSYDAAKISCKPMVASHTVCKALNGHCRGKTDEVMKAIADGGGTVGICAIPAFLGQTGDIAAFLDHIDYAVKLLGADHVTIGTDVPHHSQYGKMQGEKFAGKFPKRRRCWNNYWRADDPLWDAAWNKPEQIDSLAWTNWPLYTVGLVQRGHSDEAIRKIIGGNVMRILDANTHDGVVAD